MCNNFEYSPMENMLCKDFYFSSCGHFVWWSETDWTILVKGILRNICVKLFGNWTRHLKADSVNDFF